MKILNIDTKAVVELELISPTTGCSYIADFIGNAGGFVNGDFKKVDTETHDFEATDESLAWWTNTVSLQQKCDALFVEQAEKFGQYKVFEAIQSVSSPDLDTEIELQIKALSEIE